jgi:cytoskeletal protein RodZ
MTELDPNTPGLLGQSLKNRRLQKGLALADVTRALRVPTRYLSALEEERWSDLPARVYLEGFLVKYADFLGLDSKEMVARVREALGVGEKPGFSHPKPVPEAVDDASLAPIRFGLLLVALVLAGAGGFYFFRHQEARTTLADLPLNQVTEPEVVFSTVAATGAATVPVVAVDTPNPAGHTLVLRATLPVWVRVRLDGAVKFEGTLKAGDMRTWPFNAAARLRVGNSSRVELSVDGTTAPKSESGAPGDFVWPSRNASAGIVPSVPVSTPTAVAP